MVQIFRSDRASIILNGHLLYCLLPMSTSCTLLWGEIPHTYLWPHYRKLRLSETGVLRVSYWEKQQHWREEQAKRLKCAFLSVSVEGESDKRLPRQTVSLYMFFSQGRSGTYSQLLDQPLLNPSLKTFILINFTYKIIKGKISIMKYVKECCLIDIVHVS